MVKPSRFKNNKLFLKLIGLKYRIYFLIIRFKVSMINDLGNCHEETVIANNEKEAKLNAQTFNPTSKVLETKWVYK